MSAVAEQKTKKTNKFEKSVPPPKAADPHARPMPVVGWTVGFWPNREKRGEFLPAVVLRVNGHQLRLQVVGGAYPTEGVYQHKHPYLEAKPAVASRAKNCWDWIPGFEQARLAMPGPVAAVPAASPPASHSSVANSQAADALGVTTPTPSTRRPKADPVADDIGTI